MSLSNGACEMADGKSRRANSGHKFLKVKKSRAERRKAKRDPQAAPTYGRYAGYQT
jgi:hypothetical protein